MNMTENMEKERTPMASSEEEAKEKAPNGESVYEEIWADTVEPVDEFIVNVRGETPWA